MSADFGRSPAGRCTMSARRSSSPTIPRATATLARASARAARYAAPLPPNRAATIRRSAASTADGLPAVECSRSTARTTSEVSASSRSPVTLATAATLEAESGVSPYTQRIPAGRSICPSRRSSSSSSPSDGRGVAEPGIARPQPDAGGVGLVGIVRALVSLRPAPGPHVREAQLLRDLLRRESLPLRDVEPARARLQPFPATRPRPGLEPDHEPDARRRNPDREELRGRAAIARPQATRPADRSVAPDDVRVGVVLEHEVADLGDGSPPGGRVSRRVRLARHEQRRASSALREPADEAKHVRAVALRRGRQWHRERRAPHLVERDQRLRTPAHRDRVVEERVRALLHRVRVGRLGGRADPLAQIHVPVHGAGARRSRPRGDALAAGSDHDARARKAFLPERDRAVGEVDPDGLRLGQAAGERRRAGGRDDEQRRRARGRNCGGQQHSHGARQVAQRSDRRQPGGRMEVAGIFCHLRRISNHEADMEAVVAPGSLFGRERELARIHRYLERAETGASALVLEGEAGIGKTTLWQAGVEAALERGRVVLQARPAEAERDLSFSGLGDLLEPALGQLEALPAPRRRALEVALLLTPDDRVAPDARAVAVGTLDLLRMLAAVRPLLVAVDDTQWLDPPSRQTLVYALRRLEREPVALLTARRPGGDDDGLGEADRVAVGPLSLSALHELIRSRASARMTRPTLVRIHETSGGNPFFALELVRALEGRELRPGDPLPVPATLTDLTASRFARLDPETSEVLLYVAALARPTREVVAAARGEDVRSALEAAAAEALIETEGSRLRFTHPLLASVHYSSASPDERALVHRRLAEVATDPEERGRHLGAAADRPGRGGRGRTGRSGGRGECPWRSGGGSRAVGVGGPPHAPARRRRPYGTVARGCRRPLRSRRHSARLRDPRAARRGAAARRAARGRARATLRVPRRVPASHRARGTRVGRSRRRPGAERRRREPDRRRVDPARRSRAGARAPSARDRLRRAGGRSGAARAQPGAYRGPRVAHRAHHARPARARPGARARNGPAGGLRAHVRPGAAVDAPGSAGRVA